ncbi:hypothetical protein [Deinococcus saxicola]
MERVEIRAKAAEVSIPLIALAWLPFVSENGALRAAWVGVEG